MAYEAVKSCSICMQRYIHFKELYQATRTTHMYAKSDQLTMENSKSFFTPLRNETPSDWRHVYFDTTVGLLTRIVEVGSAS